MCMCNSVYDETIKMKSSHALLFSHTGVYGGAQVCTQAHSDNILMVKSLPLNNDFES